jgi:hypothetical protein
MLQKSGTESNLNIRNRISFGIPENTDSNKAFRVSSNDHSCCQVTLGGFFLSHLPQQAEHLPFF